MIHARLVKQIWEERINQKIDASVILMSELKKLSGLKNSQTFLELSVADENLTWLCECLAIESSLARALRNKTLSHACLRQIENEIPPAVIFNSFIYQFEKAISYFSESEWIEAVHHFLKAKKLADNPLQKATCLINLILCSENLDILNTQSLDELLPLVNELDTEIRKGIESQIHSLKLRTKWRKAELTADQFTELGNQDINQSSYFLTYLERIPYLASRESEIRLEKFIKRPGHLFNKDFRIRTLTYQWNEADQNTGRISDHIERIYLWTWKWIENPLQFPVGHLTKAIKSFPWSELDHIDKLSVDNQSLFLLSIGWLSLFDSSLAGLHKSFSKKIKFAVNHRYLMSENNIQAALLDKTLQESRCTPIENAILKILTPSLAAIELPAALITIDLANFSIYSPRCRTVHSKSLAIAGSLLLENENVAVDVFFNKTLSRLEYDAFLNSHQISNVIYKLNRILGPAIVIRQKDGLIFAVGNKSDIQIKYADHRTQILKSNEDWGLVVQELRNEFSVITENKTKSRRKKYVIMLSRYPIFSRIHLQKELRLSKTEANRLIQNWLTDKLVFKKGFGKNTVYHFNNMTKKVA